MTSVVASVPLKAENSWYDPCIIHQRALGQGAGACGPQWRGEQEALGACMWCARLHAPATKGAGRLCDKLRGDLTEAPATVVSHPTVHEGAPSAHCELVCQALCGQWLPVLVTLPGVPPCHSTAAERFSLLKSGRRPNPSCNHWATNHNQIQIYQSPYILPFTCPPRSSDIHLKPPFWSHIFRFPQGAMIKQDWGMGRPFHWGTPSIDPIWADSPAHLSWCTNQESIPQ